MNPTLQDFMRAAKAGDLLAFTPMEDWLREQGEDERAAEVPALAFEFEVRHVQARANRHALATAPAPDRQGKGLAPEVREFLADMGFTADVRTHTPRANDFSATLTVPTDGREVEATRAALSALLAARFPTTTFTIVFENTPTTPFGRDAAAFIVSAPVRVYPPAAR